MHTRPTAYRGGTAAPSPAARASLAILAVLAFAAPISTLSIASAEETPAPVVRRLVVDWERPGFAAAPPYLGGYRMIEPDGTAGSVFLGKFRQSAEIANHYVVMPNLEYVFQVEGTASDSDLVITTTIPWYGFMDHRRAAAGTLYVAFDDGERRLLPSEWHSGALFFDMNGRGIPFAKPLATVIDVPDGEHVVRVGAVGLVGPYALMNVGVFVGEAPPGDESNAPVGEKAADEGREPPPGG